MYITKERVCEIAKKHFIFNDSDAEDAFEFVWQIICEEHDALEKAEPHASNPLKKLDIAEHEVYDLMGDVIDIISESIN